MSKANTPQDQGGDKTLDLPITAGEVDRTPYSSREGTPAGEPIREKVDEKPEDGEVNEPCATSQDGENQLSAASANSQPEQELQKLKYQATVEEEKKDDQAVELVPELELKHEERPELKHEDQPDPVERITSEVKRAAADLDTENLLQDTTQCLSTFSLRTNQHLEGYALRPHVQINKESVVWSYKTESILVDENALLALMENLGPKYSVIDAMGTLLPEQLRLVQEMAKSRLANLVAVQHGMPVDMYTPMGTFKVNSVVFVIKVTKEDEDKVQEKTALFGTTQISAPPPGMFQPNPPLAFGAPKTTGNPYPAGCPLPADPVIPQRPQRWFSASERNEGSYFTEPDGLSGSGKDSYMSIPFAAPYQNQSFEELRLSDYHAEQKGPQGTGQRLKSTLPADIFGPLGAIGRKKAADRPTRFGGSLFGAKPAPSTFLFASHIGGSGEASNKPNTGLFGGNATPPQGGLFDDLKVPGQSKGPSPFGGTVKKGGGLFSQLNPTRPHNVFARTVDPSPAGKSTADASTGLFGGSPASQSGGGLFGGDTSKPFVFGAPVAPGSSGSLFAATPKTPSGSLAGLAAPTQSGEPTTASTTGGSDHDALGASGNMFAALPETSSGGLLESKSPPRSAGGLSGGSTSAPTAGASGASVNTDSSGVLWAAGAPEFPARELLNPVSRELLTPVSKFPSAGISGSAAQPRPMGSGSTQQPVFGSCSPFSNTSAPKSGGFGSQSATPNPFTGTQNSTPAQAASPFASLVKNYTSFSAKAAAPTDALKKLDPATKTSETTITAPSEDGKKKEEQVPGRAAASTKAVEKPDLATKSSETTTTAAPGREKKKDEQVPQLACHKCKTSLIFHHSAEQAARLCDACKGVKDTTCWLCERKLKSAAAALSPPAPPTDGVVQKAPKPSG